MDFGKKTGSQGFQRFGRYLPVNISVLVGVDDPASLAGLGNPLTKARNKKVVQGLRGFGNFVLGRGRQDYQEANLGIEE